MPTLTIMVKLTTNPAGWLEALDYSELKLKTQRIMAYRQRLPCLHDHFHLLKIGCPSNLAIVQALSL
jgi:hypothetical protein